ncbi:MAG TPA: hypothetical protein VMP11_01080 [Verrucomicrobiae bacterium]|nr:hypothetical protein [Verrucomicrobiae bacterium]
MHVTTQQLKDHLSALIYIVLSVCFGVWIVRNFPTRAGRAMGSVVVLAGILLVLAILFHDLNHH